jgi:hypothetical protein
MRVLLKKGYRLCPHVRLRREKESGFPVFTCRYSGACRWQSANRCGTGCYAYNFIGLSHEEDGWQMRRKDDKPVVEAKCSGPAPLMTVAELQAYLVRCYFDRWMLNEAARIKTTLPHAQAVKWLAQTARSGGRGFCGPASPRYDTREGKVRAWLPQTEWSKPPDLTFTVEKLARLALAECGLTDAPREQTTLF